MRKNRKHSLNETEVDMTPMLDIVFIMLIFFIVTTSFVKENGIVLNRPAEVNEPFPTPPKFTPVLIEISEMSEITIAGRLIDANAIRANIETARVKKPDAAVVIRAHRLASTGIVVSAVNQAKLAGADNVAVTKPVG